METLPAEPAKKRPRHLMDPNNPVRPVNDKSLTHVQRWVLSVLAVFTIAHLCVGIVIAATMTDQRSGQIGLSIIAGLFGVGAVILGQGIHKHDPRNGWLLIGLLPTAVGLFLVLR
ncbi:hypothetical protein [Nocardioides nematodiphilus]|uniref:hypothetical protein n=1 Tax=Nocardioides nematodiphilus TaxID=2849669 RepID=UPI001CDA0320|nr:hypothetical protein [Nocardioides nematodiphilus]MCA1982646.1 hypothetical protein [Nocardioides nematodiphilus]MCA1983295.1 hypothetical protein [Nocardioides nematodiphilus]